MVGFDTYYLEYQYTQTLAVPIHHTGKQTQAIFRVRVLQLDEHIKHANNLSKSKNSLLTAIECFPPMRFPFLLSNSLLSGREGGAFDLLHNFNELVIGMERGMGGDLLHCML